MDKTITAKRCSTCDSEFDCSADQSCWCMAFPPVMPADFTQDCRCRGCLALAVEQQVAASIEQRGIEEMVELARPYRSASEAVEGIDYTLERGNYVFSRWFHLKRGSCCESGCRNCPFKDS